MHQAPAQLYNIQRHGCRHKVATCWLHRDGPCNPFWRKSKVLNFDSFSLQDDMVTVMIMPKQPSRRELQHQLHGATASPYSLTQRACPAASSMQTKVAPVGWVPLPGLTQRPDFVQQSPAASEAGTASELQPLPQAGSPHQQTGPAPETKAAASGQSSLRNAASLPELLPGSAADDMAAAVLTQQSFDTAAGRWKATVEAAAESPTAGSAAAPAAAASQLSDVLHTIATTGMPCSVPGSDAMALPPSATLQAAVSGGSHAAAPAGTWACQVCGQAGMTEEAAWHHIKVTLCRCQDLLR